MSWPIPTPIDSDPPEPISWRAWISALPLIAGSAAGLVLIFWPTDKSTQTLTFWFWLLGAPAIACCLAFAFRLDRWEREQVQIEEEKIEQDRINALWRDWCRRRLTVSSAFAYTSVDVARFVDAVDRLPVNRDRAKPLPWTKEDTEDRRREKAVAVIAKRLAEQSPRFPSVDVRLLIDCESQETIGKWRSALTRALQAAVPNVAFSVTPEPVTECARWIARHVDEDLHDAKLVVAAQIWPDGESEHTFSEGLAAILFAPTDCTRRIEADAGAAYILRPMASAADDLESDIAQMVAMQVSPQRLTHLWHTGCDLASSSAVLSAIKVGPKDSVAERSFDHVIGLPGPATSWIMMATALEAAQTSSEPQFLASHEASGQLCLCAIVPATKNSNAEGKRSES